MSKVIKLVESKHKEPLQEKPDYLVMFKGEHYSMLYFNMTGYVGYLPYPSNGGVVQLDMGEQSITAYRKQARALNKKWAEIDE